MKTFITKLYEHNRWANLLLIEACRNLSEDQLDMEHPDGTYGSIRKTLLHLASAEGRYVWRLGGSSGQPPSEDQGFPGFDELKRKLEASGSALIEAAISEPGDKPLTAAFDGKTYSYVADLVKIQAINHGTDHRSQIATMMTMMNVTPPEMDGWSFGYEAGLMRVEPQP